MKVEEGKYYRTRDGRKVGPMRGVTGDFEADHEDNDLNGHVWTPNGTQWWVKDGDKTKLDLIAEWADEPEAEPTPWKDMTDAEKGALLLADLEGQAVEYWDALAGKWSEPVAYRPKWFDYDAYRVKPDPVVETVTLKGGVYEDCAYMFEISKDLKQSWYTHRITFDTVDGVPDCSTVKMEKL